MKISFQNALFNITYHRLQSKALQPEEIGFCILEEIRNENLISKCFVFY